MVLASSPSFVGVLAICPSYNTLHSCSLATSCSTSTESRLWASPMPRSWSGFAQAAPAPPCAMQASLRPTLANLRGRGLEGPRKEMVGFPGERSLESVRGRRRSQSGESGVLGGKSLVVSVGWSLLGGQVFSKAAVERAGSRDRNNGGFQRGGFRSTGRGEEGKGLG